MCRNHIQIVVCTIGIIISKCHHLILSVNKSLFDKWDFINAMTNYEWYQSYTTWCDDVQFASCSGVYYSMHNDLYGECEYIVLLLVHIMD